MKRILTAILLGAALLFSAHAEDPTAPFRPGATSNLAVTGTAQSFTLPSAGFAVQSAYVNYVITTIGTQTAFAMCDGTAGQAATVATVNNGMPFLANSQVIIKLPVTITRCSIIAGAVGTTIYATAGSGQ